MGTKAYINNDSKNVAKPIKTQATDRKHKKTTKFSERTCIKKLNKKKKMAKKDGYTQIISKI